MTAAELKNAIKSADFNRCFIFCGEEEYLKRFYMKELRNAILTDEAFASFNHFVFEGEKIDYSKLYDAIASPPMMTEYKLVEWHLANFDALREADIEHLCDFCRAIKDYPFSCVLFFVNAEHFNLGNFPKKPTKLYTLLSECSDVVVFGRSTDAQLMGWIQRHIQHEGLNSDQSTCRALLFQCGRDMDVLSSEIDKVCAYAKANGLTSVDEKMITQVCSFVLECDAFGLENALLSRNRAQAFENLLDLKRKKTEPTIVLGSVFKLYTDILTVASLMEDGMSQKDIAQKLRKHEYIIGLRMKYVRETSLSAIEAIVRECRRIDISAKTSMANAYTALERFISANI